MKSACRCPSMSNRRAVQIGAGWILPSLMLILLPKCPLCLAATISLLFGIGLSAQAASVVYGTVVALCIVTIVAFATRQVSLLRRKRRTMAAASKAHSSAQPASC
jgi:inner membrane protein involved in colicin E2 resistance